MCVSTNPGELSVPVLLDISSLPVEPSVKVSMKETRSASDWAAETFSFSPDLDECAQPFSPCMHHCTNTAGSYRCLCGDGFKLSGTSACAATGRVVLQSPTRWSKIHTELHKWNPALLNVGVLHLTPTNEADVLVPNFVVATRVKAERREEV